MTEIFSWDLTIHTSAWNGWLNRNTCSFIMTAIESVLKWMSHFRNVVTFADFDSRPAFACGKHVKNSDFFSPVWCVRAYGIVNLKINKMNIIHQFTVNLCSSIDPVQSSIWPPLSTDIVLWHISCPTKCLIVAFFYVETVYATFYHLFWTNPHICWYIFLHP